MNTKIELNEQEIELIRAALDVYETQPMSDEFSGAMFGLMLTPKEQREEFSTSLKEKANKAAEEGKRRRDSTILLKAKFIMALNTIVE